MATSITVTARGTATEATSDLSFALTPTGNFASGSMGVMVVALDNADTSGNAHSTFTCTDTLGNTWTRRVSPLYDPGAAAAGVEGAIFTTAMNGGTITTGTTITITVDANTTGKAMCLWEIASSPTGMLAYRHGAVGTGGSGTGPGLTFSVESRAVAFLGWGFEFGGETVTQDSAGGMSSPQEADNGTASASGGMTCYSQYYGAAGAGAGGTYTWAPSIGIARDQIGFYIVIRQRQIRSMIGCGGIPFVTRY